MMEIFRRAHDHKGAAFVEIYQNCNVFNDGAFETVTGKDVREDMLIPLVHGEPIRFGADGERGVMIGTDGRLRVVDVADVGEDASWCTTRPTTGPGLHAVPPRPRAPRADARSACSGPSSGPSTPTMVQPAARRRPGAAGPGRPRTPCSTAAPPGPSSSPLVAGACGRRPRWPVPIGRGRLRSSRSRPTVGVPAEPPTGRIVPAHRTRPPGSAHLAPAADADRRRWSEPERVGRAEVPGAGRSAVNGTAEGQSSQVATYSARAERQGRSEGDIAEAEGGLSRALNGRRRAAGRSRSAASRAATPAASTPRTRSALTIQLVARDRLGCRSSAWNRPGRRSTANRTRSAARSGA